MAGGFTQVLYYVQACSPSIPKDLCRTITSSAELKRQTEQAKNLWDFFTNSAVQHSLEAAGTALAAWAGVVWYRVTKRTRPSS